MDDEPTTSGGYQTTPRQLLKSKSFIKGDELSDSHLQALYTANSTQYVKITKFAIQRFLEECLRPDGMFRKFFDKFAPFTGNFVVNENFDGDKRKRHLQIARYFADMRERPPQFFIQDGGYQYKPASLGGLTGGWNQQDKQGNQVVHIFDSVPVPIDITFASTSEDDVDMMGGFIGMAFGQFQRFLMNWYIQPDEAVKGAYWIVMLPYSFGAGSKVRQNLHGDPDEAVWLQTFNFDCTFENSTYLTYRSQPVGDLSPGRFEVIVPSKITLSDTVPIQFKDLPFPVKVYSEDYRIAIVQRQNTQYIIYPKRVGKFNLVVAKSGGTEQERDILAKQEVQIVLR